MPFTFRQTEIPEVILIEPRIFPDGRGFFLESYKYSAFKEANITDIFVQDNHSQSVRGVLRGLHYQKHPAAQAKLIRIISGEVFDVAVDIRKGSPTFGRWVGATLSAENKKMLYIPQGFAHGFLVLSERAELLYKVTAEYSAQNERGIIWNDPHIGITWPITDPLLSGKDRELPLLSGADYNFEFQG